MHPVPLRTKLLSNPATLSVLGRSLPRVQVRDNTPSVAQKGMVAYKTQWQCQHTAGIGSAHILTYYDDKDRHLISIVLCFGNIWKHQWPGLSRNGRSHRPSDLFTGQNCQSGLDGFNDLKRSRTKSPSTRYSMTYPGHCCSLRPGQWDASLNSAWPSLSGTEFCDKLTCAQMPKSGKQITKTCGTFVTCRDYSAGIRQNVFPPFPNRINDSLSAKLPAPPRRSAVPLSPADQREISIKWRKKDNMTPIWLPSRVQRMYLNTSPGITFDQLDMTHNWIAKMQCLLHAVDSGTDQPTYHSYSIISTHQTRKLYKWRLAAEPHFRIWSSTVRQRTRGHIHSGFISVIIFSGHGHN